MGVSSMARPLAVFDRRVMRSVSNLFELDRSLSAEACAVLACRNVTAAATT